MKKLLAILLSFMMIFVMLAGCGQSEEGEFKVGMVTDAGTIDDKSFNEGTWNGLVRATDELGLERRYLQPGGTTPAAYLQEISNLYDAGFKFIVAPGFKFETAIYEAQGRYEDAKFVLIDGSPHSGDFSPVVGDNTVSIFYAEHEAGFLAGVAASLQLQDADFGFIGGMEIPPVQKFNWGFQQGVAYANENFGTSCRINATNVLYQGTFEDVAAGQAIAAQMYERGVDAIFAAAGGVGIGAINEAKARASAGEQVWIIGVDVDQYNEGIYSGDRSIILTSAMKMIDVSTYDMIVAESNGNFPGGQTLVFDATNDGIGIPPENPNLDADVQARVQAVFEDIQSGTLVVSDVQGDLIK